MAKFVGNFTEAMKEYTEKKLEKLSSRGIDYENARVTYERVSKNNCVVEISIGNKIRAKKKGLAEDFYDIVLEVISCITSQIDRYNKYIKRHAEKPIVSEIDDCDDTDVPVYTISKNKSLFVESMQIEDAIEEMEVLGHSFFIFKDIDNGNVLTVLYSRYDGTYGTIEVEDE